MSKNTTTIEGMDELMRAFKELSEIPRKDVTAAARAGAAVARTTARKIAPVKTGALKKGIVTKMERYRVKGKAVADVVMDPKKSDVFVKYAANGQRYYYPASQEGGFNRPGKGNGKPKDTEGRHFLREGLMESKSPAEAAVIKKLLQRIDKSWKGS